MKLPSFVNLQLEEKISGNELCNAKYNWNLEILNIEW